MTLARRTGARQDTIRSVGAALLVPVERAAANGESAVVDWEAVVGREAAEGSGAGADSLPDVDEVADEAEDEADGDAAADSLASSSSTSIA